MRTVTLRPIDQLTEEWKVTGRSSASRHALGRLADAEGIVAALGVPDLDSLIERLRSARGVAERDYASQVVRAMLRSADTDPLVPRAILQAMVPGLVGVARRLAWGSGGDWEDGASFFADLLATTWEVIADWSGDDRPYAVLDLLSAVRCRLRRQVLRERSARAETLTGLGDEWDSLGSRISPVGAATTPAGLTDLEHLAHAIDDLDGRGVEHLDATVVYGHRILGLTMTEIVAGTGRPRRQLDARRKRAEQEICA